MATANTGPGLRMTASVTASIRGTDFMRNVSRGRAHLVFRGRSRSLERNHTVSSIVLIDDMDRQGPG